MNRYIVLVLSLALPLDANAFQPFTRHIDGATITATRSATQACGVDLHITLTDQDQRMVIIDYSYSGTFEASTFNGPYTAGKNLEYLSRDTRSGVINASMGNLTYLGRSHLTYADPRGLYCLKEWTFTITAARTYNATQDQRNHQDELKRKEQARIDEINRRKAEEVAKEQRRLQQKIDFEKAKVQSKYDTLANYRRTTPEGAGCILNDLSDMAKCNKWIVQDREDKIRQNAKAAAETIAAQRKLEADRQAAEFLAAQQRENEAHNERVRTNPCAVADQARRMPQPTAQPNTTNSAAAMQQQAQAQAQRKAWQAQIEEMCASTKSQPQAIQQQPLLQQQEAQRLQAEQQKRLLAQQKARADLDAAIQQGKKDVSEAENNTQTMQNDNADLMNLINKMQ